MRTEADTLGSWHAEGVAASGQALASPRATTPVSLETERATDSREGDRRIAARDIPATPEIEVLARGGDQVLGLLTDVQDDEPAVRGLDERIDALLARDA